MAYLKQYWLSTPNDKDSDWKNVINDHQFNEETKNKIWTFWNVNFNPKDQCKLDIKKSLDSNSKDLNKLFDSIIATNYFLDRNYIAYKFIQPESFIFAEIFVYSYSFEGTHIRGGKVARGGIRWSERSDYRVEVKDLARAQILKNTIIVPTGSKGGFVINKVNADLEFVKTCYREFISGLLEVTDLETEATKRTLKKLNFLSRDMFSNSDAISFNKSFALDSKTKEKISRHHQDYEVESIDSHHLKTKLGQEVTTKVHKYFEHDPYLVVAADKGTASFSDIANNASKNYGFWLRDAFASGGLNGYSHKMLGITSRGGFESLKEHFKDIKQLGKDIISVIGIGDMNGDVFGNGLLLYEKYKLFAAFSSKFIFLDPNPNVEESFTIRQYMFDNQLSWDKYPNAEVYPRSQNDITISEEASTMLGLPRKTYSYEIIQAILKLRVDLIWSGGVGTYIKSSCENHLEALDPVNDIVRINANEIKAKVIVEGANLSITQLGRIEAAANGVKLNTDFIDNSGGVNCSDLEVNIKILLYHLNISENEASKIIRSLEDEVVYLVLQNNENQNKALNIYDQLQNKPINNNVAVTNYKIYQKFANYLIEQKILDNTFVTNHSKKAIFSKNINQDQNKFTRPELAVLLSGSKIYLKSILDKFNFDDSILINCLNHYYPSRLFKILKNQISNFNILNNPIKHEIAVTIVTNHILNKIPGPIFFENLEPDTIKMMLKKM